MLWAPRWEGVFCGSISRCILLYTWLYNYGSPFFTPPLVSKGSSWLLLWVVLAMSTCPSVCMLTFSWNHRYLLFLPLYMVAWPQPFSLGGAKNSKGIQDEMYRLETGVALSCEWQNVKLYLFQWNREQKFTFLPPNAPPVLPCLYPSTSSFGAYNHNWHPSVSRD